MKRIITALLMTAALACAMLAVPGTASAQVYVGVSVGYAPPGLPWYPQPVCPGDGYLWTPGYWAWSPYGYFWVPGTWVLAPAVGLFWTPGYWAWNGGYYWWQPGYWGSVVGYYGGINYGYGYMGYGYAGGYWRRGAFYYNRSITNVNVTYIHNTYNQTVINPGPATSRVSYNGGVGGTRIRPTVEQLTYMREQHVNPTAAQLHQERLALDNPAQRFAVNHGRPEIAATSRPGVFTGADVVRMNAERTGYVYRGEARPLPPSYPNGARVEREPQVRPENSNADRYRQPAYPNGNDHQAPVRAANPRPVSPPEARDKEHHPQPPRMNYGNSYANAYSPSMRTDSGDWNANRSEAPHPQRIETAPVRQVFRSAPRSEQRVPVGNSEREHGNRRPPR